MLSQFFILFMLIFSSINIIQTIEFGCEHNLTTYSVGDDVNQYIIFYFYSFKINAEWILSESCQTCKCLSNKIIICRNRTCQMPKDCRMVKSIKDYLNRS
jgi:hypothetical protein